MRQIMASVKGYMRPDKTSYVVVIPKEIRETLVLKDHKVNREYRDRQAYSQLKTCQDGCQHQHMTVDGFP